MRNSVSEAKIARESPKIAPNSQEPRHPELPRACHSEPGRRPGEEPAVLPSIPISQLVIPTEADHRKAMICEVEGPVVSFLAHPSVEDFDPIRPKSKRRSPRPRLSENFSLFLEYQIDRGKPEIFQTL
jgi:hypothetical protein